jgi:hypothetical protein
MTRLSTEFQDLGDIKIAYWQHGSGPDLLLLHGNSESKTIFSHYLLDHFTGFHTWALDSRFHGESQSQEDSLSIELIADDVIASARRKGSSRHLSLAIAMAATLPSSSPKRRRSSSRKLWPSRPTLWSAAQKTARWAFSRQSTQWSNFSTNWASR